MSILGSCTKKQATLSLNQTTAEWTGQPIESFKIISSVLEGEFTLVNSQGNINIWSDGSIFVPGTTEVGLYSFIVKWEKKGYETTQKSFSIEILNSFKPTISLSTSTIIWNDNDDKFIDVIITQGTKEITGGQLSINRNVYPNYFSVVGNDVIKVTKGTPPGSYSINLQWIKTNYQDATNNTTIVVERGIATDLIFENGTIDSHKYSTPYTGGDISGIKILAVDNDDVTISGGTFTKQSGDSRISIDSYGNITLASNMTPDDYALSVRWQKTNYDDITVTFNITITDGNSPSIIFNQPSNLYYTGQEIVLSGSNGLTATVPNGSFSKLLSSEPTDGITIRSDGAIILSSQVIPGNYSVDIQWTKAYYSPKTQTINLTVTKGQSPTINLQNESFKYSANSIESYLISSISGGTFSLNSTSLANLTVDQNGKVTIPAATSTGEHNFTISWTHSSFQQVSSKTFNFQIVNNELPTLTLQPPSTGFYYSGNDITGAKILSTEDGGNFSTDDPSITIDQSTGNLTIPGSLTPGERSLTITWSKTGWGTTTTNFTFEILNGKAPTLTLSKSSATYSGVATEIFVNLNSEISGGTFNISNNADGVLIDSQTGKITIPSIFKDTYDFTILWSKPNYFSVSENFTFEYKTNLNPSPLSISQTNVTWSSDMATREVATVSSEILGGTFSTTGNTPSYVSVNATTGKLIINSAPAENIPITIKWEKAGFSTVTQTFYFTINKVSLALQNSSFTFHNTFSTNSPILYLIFVDNNGVIQSDDLTQYMNYSFSGDAYTNVYASAKQLLLQFNYRNNQNAFWLTSNNGTVLSAATLYVTLTISENDKYYSFNSQLEIIIT
ncbi:MAG: hypothetical protein LBF36_03800 [Mycoplasmataceae bacterium]|nr:hypothetical protein [Mycoplasmataceae bacterium]